MTLDLVLLTVVCVLNLSLGSFVLLRNHKVRYAVYFFLMSVFLSAWATTNYLTNLHTALIWNDAFNKGAYLSALLALLFATLFTFEFPHRRHIVTYEKVTMGLVGLGLGLLSVTAYVAGHVTLSAGGELKFSTGTLLGLYGFGFVLLVMFVIRNLIDSYRKVEGVTRQQVIFIFVGFSITAIFGFLANVIIPILVENWQSTRIGPLLSLALVASITYSIVRHRMFDIRAVVARLFGYSAALLALSVAYGLIMFLVAQKLFAVQLSFGAEVFFSLSMAVIALAFQPFKRNFDRLTTRVFYQDAYDPQELFDKLNKLLVSSLDIKYLMQKSSVILAESLKPQFCAIALQSEDGPTRNFGEKFALTPEDFDSLRVLTLKMRSDIIITDELQSEKFSSQKELLQTNGIAVLVRLSQNSRRSEQGMGYIALGMKKSGNPYGPQDVRTLEAVANELVLAIQNALHFEEIQRFNVILQTRVDDATRKLRRTNDKLKSLDETKDDFISMASHQLRTPLTSVKGYLSMVIEGDAGPINDTQKKMLGQAFISSQRMVYLIADLLNVSRLRTGKFIIDTAPTNLAEMVGEELDQLVETAAARDIKLTYVKPKAFPDLLVDETKTRQVIMNFVDNAIYYTPAGGHIKVELQETPTSVELKVVDDGIGVPRAEQHHLFTKFYRAGNARKARPDGTGLGLYMAKKVILAQGGSIVFESREGKGSTFGFLFPKNANHIVKPLPVQEVSVSK